MSHHLLPTSKLFQLTALTLSLALAGCGGGGTDTVAPEPDLGTQQPGTGNIAISICQRDRCDI